MIVDRARWLADLLKMTRFEISHFSVETFSYSSPSFGTNYDCIAYIGIICEDGKYSVKMAQNDGVFAMLCLLVCGIRSECGSQRKQCLIVISIFQWLPIFGIVNGIECLQKFLRNIDAGRIREEWCLRRWRLGVFRFNIKTYLRRQLKTILAKRIQKQKESQIRREW